MADSGNKRNFRIIDGSDDNFFVKRPEVFKTAAAAGDNQDVRPGNGAAARQGIEASDGCGDFFGGSFALYGGWPDNNAAGKAVANAVNNVTNDGAAGRGDDADDVRQKGNGFFVRRVEQAFGGKFLFSFIQKFEQRAGTGDFHLFDYQLIRGFAGKSSYFAGGDDFHAVFGFETETGGGSFPDNGGKNRVRIFQRQIPMAGIGTFGAENFASDFNPVKSGFDKFFYFKRYFADRVFGQLRGLLFRQVEKVFHHQSSKRFLA